ncbi:hypothetical protein LCGC14_0579850 [marine sediment metagenome]|uniref:Uncharacterized protein n=1 Tax=marine sediment metagenome TaxID=412755 RepID=A0A0F9UQ00_9ZZZZ
MRKNKRKHTVEQALAIVGRTGSQVVKRNQPIQKTKIEVGQTFIFAGEIHHINHTVSLLNLKEIITTVEGKTILYPWHPDIVEEIIDNQWKYK